MSIIKISNRKFYSDDSIKGTALAAVAALGLMAGTAQAALVSADWNTAGDGLLTIDGNGLKWLELTETAGMSLNSVLAELGTGGMFSGFRFAIADEITGAGGLWQSAGHDGDFSQFWTTANNGVASVLGAFIGAPATIAGYQGQTGINMVFEDPGTIPYVAAVASDYGDKFAPWTTADFFSPFNNGVADANVGNANVAMALVQVQVAPVPVPAAFPLLLVALGGLGFAARRRKAVWPDR